MFMDVPLNLVVSTLLLLLLRRGFDVHCGTVVSSATVMLRFTTLD